MTIFGKPALPWGYEELLDMPDADRRYFVKQMADVCAQLKQK